ncbi:MAG: hypothetical protein NTX81_03320 [Candidatus Bathyarchaeota archaeon]|nr:hypothetical protein [Candidatus Bathyarchaeota archaeon]
MLAIEALMLLLLGLGVFLVARKLNRWLAKCETNKPIENAEIALDSIKAATQQISDKEGEIKRARKALEEFRKTHRV